MKIKSNFSIPIYLVLAACMIVLNACQDPIIEPVSSGGDKELLQLLRGQYVNDTTSIDAFLRVACGRFSSRSGLSFSGVSDAALADTNGFVQVSSISVSGNTLLTEGGYTYQNPLVSIPEGNDSITWIVNGYQGGNLNTTVVRAKPISVSSHSWGDTISLGSGATFSYSGSQGDSVRVVLRASTADTWDIIDSSTAVATPNIWIEQRFSDNGSFTLTSTMLSSLPPGFVYTLLIEHEKYVIANGPNNSKLGMYSTYGAIVPLYLDI